MDNDDEIVTNKINKKRKLNVIDSEDEENGPKVHKVAVVKKAPEVENLESYKHKISPLKESVSKTSKAQSGNSESKSKGHTPVAIKKSPLKTGATTNNSVEKKSSNKNPSMNEKSKKDLNGSTTKPKQESSSRAPVKSAVSKKEDDKKKKKKEDLLESDASLFEADTFSESSVQEESEVTGESSDSEEEAPRKKAVPKDKPKKSSGFVAAKLQELKKKSQEQNKSKPKKEVEVKTPRELLISDILKRWWYCMPEWPPAGLDYRKLLRENGLEQSDEKTIKIEPTDDRSAFIKVYPIGFEGLYKDKKGNLYDLRPRDGCPSYENLGKKSTKELNKMLVLALQNQIAALEKFEHREEKELMILRTELKRAQKNV